MSNFDTLRITISLNQSSQGNGDFVILEQEPWDPYVGWLTKMGVFGFLNSLLFEGPETKPNCEYDGGKFGKEIYAYPSRPDLNYVAGCSWGFLGPRVEQTIDYTEDIQVKLETEVSVKYPPLSITKFGFVGVVYSGDGSIAAKPSITIGEDNKIILSEKVYATLLVTYKVCRHTYAITVPKRPGATENKLQSFVYAVWVGGNTFIEVEAPEGAEESECNNFGSGGDHFTTGDQPPSSVPPDNIYNYIDYCTQQEIDHPAV